MLYYYLYGNVSLFLKAEMPQHGFVHKSYGCMGSEFIIQHKTVEVGRLIVMFPLSVFLASVVKLHLKVS